MPTKVGFIHGTSAKLNVEIGFVPDYVKIWNATDGENIFEGWLAKVIVFTSLSATLRPGSWIKGITSGAKARIRDVIIDSGTVAGGDAAGWLICDAEDITGTIQSENAQVYTGEPGTATAATNHLGVVVDVTFGQETITSAGPITATSTGDIVAYTGTEATLRKGFTIGTKISENGDLLGYLAIGNDQGLAQEPEVAGVKQSVAAW